MGYTAWSVVYGEQPTAAKWNQLGENDAGFRDGSNIDVNAITTTKIADSAVTAAKIADRTRTHDLVITADETGGATSLNHTGRIVQFAASASAFARGKCKVPKDYAGGDILLKTMWYSSTGQTRDLNFFIDAIDNGGNTSVNWNVASNLTHTSGLPLTANTLITNTRTIPDANVSIDTHIGFAMRPVSGTGVIQMLHAYIEYTADC